MKRLFGTDGVRGAAGVFPLDEATVARIGRALVRSLPAPANRPLRCIIGRDTRESGPEIEQSLRRGIEQAGGRADLGGVLTTPAVACVTRLLGYDARIVVSPSHNPYHDNGIKIFSGGGFKLPDALEAEIEKQVLKPDRDQKPGQGSHTAATRRAAATPDGGTRPEPDQSSRSPEMLRARYLDHLRASLPDGASLSGWRVVLDCAHGAASTLAPDLFKQSGAEIVTLNAAPDGRNINEGCGALHPQRLAQEVVRHEARLGLAFDGDADRCLLVDASGRILDGDHVMYLAAVDRKRSGRLPGDTVVGTVMSNLWLEQALHAEGIRTLRAPVGDKYVLEEMQNGGYMLGGEQSGHIIFLDRATTGDGLLTGLLLLDLLQRTGLDLARWAASIRPCPQILVNVPVRSRPPLDGHPGIGPAIREEEGRLGAGGRILVRYSGTEPLARIMIEGEPLEAIEASADRLRRVIEREIGQESSS